MTTRVVVDPVVNHRAIPQWQAKLQARLVQAGFGRMTVVDDRGRILIDFDDDHLVAIYPQEFFEGVINEFLRKQILGSPAVHHNVVNVHGDNHGAIAVDHSHATVNRIDARITTIATDIAQAIERATEPDEQKAKARTALQRFREAANAQNGMTLLAAMNHLTSIAADWQPLRDAVIGLF